MKELENLIDRLTPDAAMELLSGVVKRLFSQASEGARMKFVHALTGVSEEGGDADLVHY